MKALRDSILAAAKADDIPAGATLRWHIKKLSLCRDIQATKDGQPIVVPAGQYTQLWCWTQDAIKQWLDETAGFTEDSPLWPGELVMTDSPHELNTHLDFMLRAHGRVLISGLGLGCVVRGCLANPAVQHVVCIEREPEVLKLVKPHLPTERLTILQADALSWVRNNIERQRFDCAWHDLWSDPDKNEAHLQVNHSELFVRCHGHVGFQGAWAFPRYQKRLWKELISRTDARRRR